jgi:hypothetical protein
VTNEEYGRALAAGAPPLTDEQVGQAARIYAADEATKTAA